MLCCCQGYTVYDDYIPWQPQFNGMMPYHLIFLTNPRVITEIKGESIQSSSPVLASSSGHTHLSVNVPHLVQWINYKLRLYTAWSIKLMLLYTYIEQRSLHEHKCYVLDTNAWRGVDTKRITYLRKNLGDQSLFLKGVYNCTWVYTWHSVGQHMGKEFSMLMNFQRVSVCTCM